MAAKITPKRSSGRDRMLPSGLLALLALILWTFWKYVGGGGGFFPGTGLGTESRPFGASRPTGLEPDPGSTVRRAFAQRLVPPPDAGESRPASTAQATATVKPAANGSDEREVKVKLGGASRGGGRVEVVRGSGGPAMTVRLEAGEATIPGAKKGESLNVRILEDGAPAVSGTIAVEDGERSLDLRSSARVVGRAGFTDGTPAGDREMEAKVYRQGHAAERIPFRTGPDGAIALEAPAGIDLLIELRPTGAAAGSDLAPVVFQRETLESGETWDLGSAAFETQVVLAEGVVEDEKGAPVAGASVQLLPLGLPTREIGARTDDAGRFTAKGPAAAETFDVIATTESDAARLAAPAKKGATGLKLVLAPAGRIHGTAASPAPVLNSLLRVELHAGHDNVFTTTRVLEGGSFELLHVPAGRWTLVLTAPDADPVTLEGVDVPAGAPSGDPRLAAVPVRTGLVPARLRVVDASGAGIGGARVELAFPRARTLRTTTDATGAAAVAAPPEGSVTLAVEAPGYGRHRAPWDGKQAVVLKVASAPASR
jgi:Carboxypeptidase regulatory-like domain